MSRLMQEVPISSRPYERLEAYGEASLSDAELLAVLFRSGSRGASSLDLAQELLLLDTGGQGLSFLRDKSVEELTACKGLGKVKALTIKAAMELGKRSLRGEPFWKNTQISSPSDAIMLFENEMSFLQKEEVHIALLDTRHRIIRRAVVSSEDWPLPVSIRVSFCAKLSRPMRGTDPAHNHPSGDPKPSPDDISTTRSLKKAADLIGIDLIDHIVVGRGSSSSMKELGYL